MQLLSRERRILERIMGLIDSTEEKEKALREIKTRMRVAEKLSHKKEIERLYCNV